MPKETRLYDILGVDPCCSDSELKRTYKKLALKYHPDKCGGATARFQEISHACDTLLDPQKRQIYDQYGEAGLSGECGADGGRIHIPHLDDRVLLVEILPGEVIRPGERKALMGQGMPIRKLHDFGNMYVQFEVEMPPPHWTDPVRIQDLRMLLPPPRELPTIPKGYLAEEVYLTEMDPRQRAKAAEHGHLEGDEDDESGPGHGVQCAQQ
ncbi:hypothetical protein KVV02_008027 [Mortierella alpina]|uniref:J domain-containing protein n=1 Tax=Mortierella alpina TaxID=64518 RepID=A0A9P8D077_MORAP|nr:hypothetical protein KVV02_008027 [Mortierella alpina]